MESFREIGAALCNTACTDIKDVVRQFGKRPRALIYGEYADFPCAPFEAANQWPVGSPVTGTRLIPEKVKKTS